MKRIFIFFIVLLLLIGPVFSSVVKKTKAEVSFKKFGKFTSEQSMKITENKKLTDTTSKFKGKGILGKLAGKMFLKTGNLGEIIDLSKNSIFNLNHKKKQYSVNQIMPLVRNEDGGNPSSDSSSREEEAVESDIKIIRSEFKVEDTGQSKTFNQFACSLYAVSWITEWENIRTGQKGTERLLTDVWTTPLNQDLKQAQEEELKFSREYMKKLGFDLDERQQEILGTNWLSILGAVDTENKNPRQDASEFSEEMKKIKGYPVIIDGKYFTKREGGEQDADTGGGGVKKMFGRFAKKALTKKDNSDEPVFTYYTELIEFVPGNVDENSFQIPSNYKKKGK